MTSEHITFFPTDAECEAAEKIIESVAYDAKTRGPGDRQDWTMLAIHRLDRAGLLDAFVWRAVEEMIEDATVIPIREDVRRLLASYGQAI